MPSAGDWRLTNQMGFLYEARLKHQHYSPKGTDWDHDHCSFCLEKYESGEHMGYCTLDERYWICESCYEGFREMFKWMVVEAT